MKAIQVTHTDNYVKSKLFVWCDMMREFLQTQRNVASALALTNISFCAVCEYNLTLQINCHTDLQVISSRYVIKEKHTTTWLSAYTTMLTDQPINNIAYNTAVTNTGYLLHCVPKKTCDYIFYNNFNNRCPITIIFGIVSSKSMRHRKIISFPTSPI